MATGDYRDSLEWLSYTPTTDPDNGQEVENYTSQGYLWCDVDAQGTTRQFYDSDQSGQTATIRIHQFPSVKAWDKLRDWRGQVWLVESLTYDDDGNETVCDCYKLDIEDE